VGAVDAVRIRHLENFPVFVRIVALPPGFHVAEELLQIDHSRAVMAKNGRTLIKQVTLRGDKQHTVVTVQAFILFCHKGVQSVKERPFYGKLQQVLCKQLHARE